MRTFNCIQEDSKTLRAFDMDETLFSHDPSQLKIHVRDKKSGVLLKSLSNQQFNRHKLEPHQKYDFSDFSSSIKLHTTAKPIKKMIAKLKQAYNRGDKTEIVTARSDFDDPPKFKQFMMKHGIDINSVHVRRAGNLGGPAPENKKEVISSLIKKHGYDKVHLYDDSKENLAHFLSLKQEHPHVHFYGHHVSHEPETGRVVIKTTKL